MQENAEVDKTLSRSLSIFKSNKGCGKFYKLILQTSVPFLQRNNFINKTPINSIRNLQSYTKAGSYPLTVVHYNECEIL